MEARKIIGSAVLAAWALILSAGTAAGQYKSKIDVLKGEKWWGVFVTGEQMMPLEKPFPQTDLSTWVKSQATPFLVSSRGRYIWSREPFKIEFTGSGFLIDSPVEQVEAVTGGKTLREAYLVCCHRNFPPKEGNGVPAEGFFTAPLYDMTGEIPFGATAGQIRDFAESLLASGYPSGTLVVPSGWQQTIGSFTPSWNEYGDFAALARELHERGFRVLLTVTPFVSGDGPIFRAYRNSGAFVRMSDGRAAIAEWAGGYSAFYDITDPQVFDMLRDRPVDLLFCDIQMPGLSGMELSRMLPADTRVIFTTAFSRYAVEGFRVNAVDYLLKPISYADFLAAANKALAWFELKNRAETPPPATAPQSLFVKTEYRLRQIGFDSILYIEGLKDYVKIHVEEETHPVLTLTSLKSLEEQLPADRFVRVHRSFIVQPSKIRSIERNRIVFGKEYIPVSENYRQAFFDFLAEHSLLF